MERCNPFYCFICNRTIIDDESQYNHFESHLFYKPFKCLDCNETYYNKSQLETHLAFTNHFNYQKYTEIKLRKFINSLGALSHQMNITNEKNIVSVVLVTKQDNESVGRCLGGNVIKQEVETNINKNTIERPSMIPVNYELERVDRSKNLDYVIKMRNDGYLDIRKLNSQKFIRKNYIERWCKICNKIVSGTKEQIIHVFEKHLNLINHRFLKCYICSSKGINNKKFIDFSSVMEHYKGTKSHRDLVFQNNLMDGYKGNEQFVSLDGDNDILYRYEIEFEKCFVEK